MGVHQHLRHAHCGEALRIGHSVGVIRAVVGVGRQNRALQKGRVDTEHVEQPSLGRGVVEGEFGGNLVRDPTAKLIMATATTRFPDTGPAGA